MDEKGRVAVPAKFRGLFDEGGVVTRGFDPCLVLYPTGEWDAFADRIASLPTSQADARSVAREVFSAASENETTEFSGTVTTG